MNYQGLEVKVTLTTTKDTYYGTFANDEQFVYLTDYKHGWWGEAGWWYHGKGPEIAFPIQTVKSVAPVSELP